LESRRPTDEINISTLSLQLSKRITVGHSQLKKYLKSLKVSTYSYEIISVKSFYKTVSRKEKLRYAAFGLTVKMSPATAHDYLNVFQMKLGNE